MKQNGWISIRNWDRFQHYKQRNPPWIRLYRDLLRHPEYQMLSDTGRSHLIGLFILASQHSNRIPKNESWLKHELCTKAAIDLKTLEASGWIVLLEQDASDMLADSDVLAPRKLAPTESCPDTDNSDNSETDSSDADGASAPMLAEFGEFRWVRVTTDQHAKLKTKLNGNLESYIDRFDRWVNDAPDAKVHGVRRRDRHAYETILNWFDRDVKEGKVHTHQAPSLNDPAEVQRLRESMFGKKAK